MLGKKQSVSENKTSLRNIDWSNEPVAGVGMGQVAYERTQKEFSAQSDKTAGKVNITLNSGYIGHSIV